jgi:hypothetical protein
LEKILAYVARADECLILASRPPADKTAMEYVLLATSWLDLAEERNQFLIEAGRVIPH